MVVILIIGILAAIALPAFLNQRTKAQDTEAKTAVRNARTTLETFHTDRQTYDTDAADAEGHRARAGRGARTSTVTGTDDTFSRLGRLAAPADGGGTFTIELDSARQRHAQLHATRARAAVGRRRTPPATAGSASGI